MERFREFWSEVEAFVADATISEKLKIAWDGKIPALSAITEDLEEKFGASTLARPGDRRRIGFLTHRRMRALGYEIDRCGVKVRGGRWSSITRYRRRAA